MKKQLYFLLPLVVMLFCNRQADAAGFALIEQSVSSMGTGYAGAASAGEDASAIFFNPALMTRFCTKQMVSGLHGVFPWAHFHNDDSIMYNEAIPGLGIGIIDLIRVRGATPEQAPYEILGSNGKDAGRYAVVPHFATTTELFGGLYFGLTVNSPFGLANDYGSSWVGRYHAIHSEVFNLNVNPSFAYRFNRCFSVGIGFNASYLHAKLTNAVDYGMITWLTSFNPDVVNPGDLTMVQEALVADGFFPQMQDGHVKLKGNDWSYGGNVGIFYEPCCGTRIGAHWRSELNYTITGKETFSQIPERIADPMSAPADLQQLYGTVCAAAATDRRLVSKVALPMSAAISAYHEFNDCWALMGDIMWMKWESNQSLVFNFSEKDGLPNQPPGVVIQKWKNVFRYAIGTIYKPNCCWTLRTGFAFDESPVRSKLFRTPRLAGEDRYWLCFGASYLWDPCLRVDVGYVHIFICPKPEIDKASFKLAEDVVRGGLRGDFTSQTDIFSLQLVLAL